ncbi:MAG: insulinase family protein [Bryobacterales bacterium]|nr:insulinase family protein [Bryobacterales bacterium]
MNGTPLLVSLILAIGVAIAPLATLGQVKDIDIPHKKFVLKNGLTLLVHEDRKAPIVAVNVWYHVGSKNEKPGKTGFAHLFEHLMFNGSENFNDDYFQALSPLGATDLNGTTNVDRTNYFQNVPTPALDTVLFLESDRMGHLLGAIDQAKLDEQRGVVQNEKRQGENQPYGKVFEFITTNAYPAGHPYSWTTIGSMDDLNAASLDDVKEWFKTYYGAANAVIAIAGDIDAETARAKVEKYFGDIPAGPPVTHQQTWVAKMTGERRQVTEDRVPQARIVMVWNIPEFRSKEATHLDLLSDVLGSGKTSRFYKRLVYQDQIATSVRASVWLKEIGGQFIVQADARPGVDLAKVEAALREELAAMLANGPAEKEVERVRTQNEAAFVRGIERIGGFGGKSDILASNEVYAGSADFFKTRLQWVRESTAADLKRAANQWLSDGVYILEVHPFPEFQTVSGVDRSKLPVPGEPPALKMPVFERAELSNGLKIMLAERHETPIVDFSLVLNSGHASDVLTTPGTAKLSMQMLDEGTRKQGPLELSDALAMLGAELNTGSDLDSVSVYLSALTKNLDASLQLFSDVILTPAFSATEFPRVQKLQLDAIRREKASPTSAALRVFPAFLYGAKHPYGNPYSGNGTEASVMKIGVADLKAFHDTWFKPNNATLLVVGDTTMAAIRPKLEALFGGWKRGAVPKVEIPSVARSGKTEVYLIDKPGAEQSVIVAGHIAPPTNNPQEPAINALNAVLGGMFTSRINMNLREDKHWSYGARTMFLDAEHQRPFIALTSVQTDKTSESMAEIQKELVAVVGDRPISAEELDKAKSTLTLTLPGSRETRFAVGTDMERIVTYGLADDYFATYPSRVRALTPAGVADTTKSILHPGSITWVVVGDLSKIKEKVEALGLGPVAVVPSEPAVTGGR